MLTRKRVGRSWVMMLIYEWFTTIKLIHAQPINKRFYRKIIPWLLRSLTLYENSGYFVMENTDKIIVLDRKKLEWTELTVIKKDETLSESERKAFFEE